MYYWALQDMLEYAVSNLREHPLIKVADKVDRLHFRFVWDLAFYSKQYMTLSEISFTSFTAM